MDREDFFLKIAELHLKRVEILQTVEWRITLSLWTFVAGVAMVSLANADKVKQAAVAIECYGVNGSAAILLPIALIYIGLGWLYAFEFCKKNYNSLVTERNRYQRMQNEAMKLVLKGKSADFLIKAGTEDKRSSGSELSEPSFKQLSGNDFRKSGIWQFKIWTTAALMFFSWLLVLMIVVPSASKHLNDSVTATGKPVGVEVESSSRNLSREADQHF